MTTDERPGSGTDGFTQRADVWIERFRAWAFQTLDKLQLSGSAVGANVASPLIWRRVAAVLVDGVVIYLLFTIANAIGPRMADTTTVTLNVEDEFWIQVVSPIQPFLAWKPLLLIWWQGLAPLSSLQSSLLLHAFGACVVWAYYAVMESSAWQGTVGKRLCGVKVTGLDGERIGLRQASIRTLAKSAAWLPYFVASFITNYTSLPQVGDYLVYPSLIGAAVAIASRRQQALHDAIADTLVAAAMPVWQRPATTPSVPPAAPPSR